MEESLDHPRGSISKIVNTKTNKLGLLWVFFANRIKIESTRNLNDILKTDFETFELKKLNSVKSELCFIIHHPKKGDVVLC